MATDTVVQDLSWHSCRNCHQDIFTTCSAKNEEDVLRSCFCTDSCMHLWRLNRMAFLLTQGAIEPLDGKDV